eukprot:6427804-Prymnesium_polylepis.1
MINFTNPDGTVAAKRKLSKKVTAWVEDALPDEYADWIVMVNEMQCYEPVRPPRRSARAAAPHSHGGRCPRARLASRFVLAVQSWRGSRRPCACARRSVHRGARRSKRWSACWAAGRSRSRASSSSSSRWRSWSRRR